MDKRVTAFFLIILITFSCSANWKLNRLRKKGEYKKAVQYIEKKFPPETRTIKYWLELADISEGLGMSEKAIGCYLTVLQKEENNKESLRSLIRIYSRMEEYDKAYKRVEKLLKLIKNDPDLLWKASKLCLNLNDKEKAKEYLLKIYKNNREATKALGDIFYSSGNSEEAIHLYKTYFQTQQSLDLAKKIVEYYKAKDSLDIAIKYVRYIADHDNSDVLYKRYIARYLIDNKEYASAIHYYIIIPEKYYEDIDYYNIGIYKKGEGKLKEAIVFFQKILEAIPLDKSLEKKIYKELGIIYLEQKEYNKAIKYFSLIKDSLPDFEFYLAKTYDILKKYDLSEKLILIYLKKYPKNIQANMIYASALEAKGKINEANKIREELIKLDPNNAKVYHEIASYYYESGQYSKAIKFFEKSYLLKTDISCMEKISICAYNIDQKVKAMETAEIVLDKTPKSISALKILYRLHMKDNKYNQAIPYIKTLNQKDPYEINYLLDLSECYKKLNKNKELYDIDEKIISIKPGNIESLRRLAIKVFEDQDYAKSFKLFSQIDSLNEIKITDYAYLIESALEINKSKNAIEYLKRYIALRPQGISLYKRLGQLYHEVGDNKSAIKTYQRIIELDPNTYGVYKDYAKILYSNGDPDSLILSIIKKAIEQNDINSDLYVIMGDIYDKNNNKEKTLFYYKKALEIEPKNKDLQAKVKIFQEKFMKLDDSIALYEQKVINEDNPKNYKILGYLYRKKKEKQKAIKAYKSYLSKVKDEEILSYVALNEHKKGNHKEAIKYFNQKKELDSEELYQVAISYVAIPHYTGALTNLLVYIKKYPEGEYYYDAHRTIGHIYQEFEDDKSIEHFNIYLEHEKDSTLAYFVAELEEKKDKDKAIASYIRNTERYPNDIRNHIKIGNLSKDKKLSIKYYEKALEIDDSLIDMYIKIGNIHDSLKNYDKAVDLYKRAINKFPNEFNFKKNLGLSFYKGKRYKDALLYLELAKSQKYDDPEILYALGLCYQNQEKVFEAINLYQSVLKINPDNDEIRYSLISALILQTLFNEAKKESEKLIRRNNSEKYFTQYIKILFFQGKYSDIIEEIKKRRLNNSENIELLMLQAKAYYMDKRYKNAIQSYVMISFIKENYIPALLGLAEVYSSLSNVENTKKYYERVIELDSKNIDAYIGLALFYKGCGIQDLYRKNVLKAKEIDSKNDKVKKELIILDLNK